MAQALVDAGVLPAAQASSTRWGSRALPRPRRRSNLSLTLSRPTTAGTTSCCFCTDGLTKHVAEDEITEQLATVQVLRDNLP
jgi:hypothetical protein